MGYYIFYFCVQMNKIKGRLSQCCYFSYLWSTSVGEFLRNCTVLPFTVTSWLSRKSILFFIEELKRLSQPSEKKRGKKTPIHVFSHVCIPKLLNCERCCYAFFRTIHLPYTFTTISATHDKNSMKVHTDDFHMCPMLQ